MFMFGCFRNQTLSVLHFEMFSDSLQVAVGDLDPGAASFPIHVLDPFFCKPYNHLRLVEDGDDDDHLTGATSPSSQPGELGKAFGLLVGFLKVRRLAIH